MNRILIATDGSDGAWAAVEDGVALAFEVGAAVVFVTVRHDTPLLGDPHYQRKLTAQLEQIGVKPSGVINLTLVLSPRTATLSLVSWPPLLS